MSLQFTPHRRGIAASFLYELSRPTAAHLTQCVPMFQRHLKNYCGRRYNSPVLHNATHINNDIIIRLHVKKTNKHIMYEHVYSLFSSIMTLQNTVGTRDLGNDVWWKYLMSRRHQHDKYSRRQNGASSVTKLNIQ